MARPVSQDSGISIDVSLDELIAIKDDLIENKIDWALKLGGLAQWKTECDRIRNAIRKKKMGPGGFSKYAATNQKRRVKDKRKRLIEDFPMICANCGFKGHHSQMDFHHKDPTKKENDVGYLLWRTSYDKLKEEIEKCIIWCSNCHRLLHWKERHGEE